MCVRCESRRTRGRARLYLGSSLTMHLLCTDYSEVVPGLVSDDARCEQHGEMHVERDVPGRRYACACACAYACTCCMCCSRNIKFEPSPCSSVQLSGCIAGLGTPLLKVVKPPLGLREHHLKTRRAKDETIHPDRPSLPVLVQSVLYSTGSNETSRR